MNLYIRQKVFSIGDHFTVKDEYGNDRYSVRGEVLSFGKKLHIYDMAGNEIAYIRQKVLAFTPCYAIEVNGVEIATIKKKLTMFVHKYTIEGLGWSVEGNFLAHDYVVCDNVNRPIINIAKQWMTWGDTYELAIDDSVDEISALAVVLCIDAAMESN